jgi:hypothetical protein
MYLFGRAFLELEVGQLFELVVGHRQFEAVAEALDRLVSIFFCWWLMFIASPASPMPKPLMVLARISVGWPLCSTAPCRR